MSAKMAFKLAALAGGIEALAFANIERTADGLSVALTSCGALAGMIKEIVDSYGCELMEEEEKSA